MIPAVWRPFVVACASGQIDDATQQRAADRLAADKAHVARVRAKARPRREAKAVKRAARNQETADLRGRLLDLTGGVCEWCERTPVPEEGQMHHTEGGGGRVERQHIGNVAWLCKDCHGMVHALPAAGRMLRESIREKRERMGQR